jgi:hypothetical protein
MALDKRISLKYWLDEPFWTTISSLDLSLKVPDYFSLAGCAEDVVFLVSVSVAGSRVLSPDPPVFGSAVALARDFSRLEMREAISAMMVLFDQRMRGPDGG